MTDEKFLMKPDADETKEQFIARVKAALGLTQEPPKDNDRKVE